MRKQTENRASKLVALGAGVTLMAGCAMAIDDPDVQREQHPETWNSGGAPDNLGHLGADYEYRLADLPTSGTAAEPPWAGWYWATYRDVINYRWDGENTDSPTAKYAKAFGIDPDALEDAVSRRSGIDSMSYATSCTDDSVCDSAKGETCAKRHGETEGRCIPTWYGQCHAWSPAAVMEPEPVDPVTVNGVTFKVQDIKALMTYVYNNVNTDFLGGRCNTDEDDVQFDDYGRPTDRSCRDTNPGAMHVILTNWLGLEGKALVEDRTWDDEVWNQPVRGFNVISMNEVSESEAAGMLHVTSSGGTHASESGTVAKGEWKHFGPYTLAADETLNANMTGTNDADLYVRVGAQPTSSEYDCRPYTGGSSESCSVAGPGDVYVSVNGWAESSDFQLAIDFGGAAEYIFNDGAERFYHVITDVKYITESYPSADGNLNEDNYTRSDRVEYILELDSEGRIMGGEWVNNNPHADFLWVPYQHAGNYTAGSYTFEYAKIKDLLNQSIGGSGSGGTGEEVTVEESGSVDKDEWIHFGPYDAGDGAFTVNMTGTNDADLYVRRGSQPTTTDYDCRPYVSGSTETCTLSGPGEIYVSVRGYSTATSSFELSMTYFGEGSGGGSGGGTATPVTVEESGTVSAGEWVHYGPYDAEAGDFHVVMTGTADADLYVKKNGQPTAGSYDCRPYLYGSDETCNLAGPGKFYVSVNGWDASSDFSLTITYNQ